MSDLDKKLPAKHSPPPEGCPQDGVGHSKGHTPTPFKSQSKRKEILTIIGSTPICRNFTSNLPSNVQLKSRARSLRKSGNLGEVIFWSQVNRGKFYKIDFDRQRVIGNYIVDFYIKGLSLVIEIDGSSHNNKEGYDDRREEYLRSLGLKIFKISEIRIHHDFENVLEELKGFILENYGTKKNL